MIMHSNSQNAIPVLLYHALFEESTNPETYAIATAAFEQHVKYLVEQGFEGVSLAEFSTAGHYVGHQQKRIAITFDDGNFSDYAHAFPILKKYGFPATFFVTVSRIGTPHYVDWRQLKEMADNGMSIQSHSLHHVFLSDLASDELQKELVESKKILEEKLSLPVDVISLPGGFISRNVLNAAEDAGYNGVATSCPGLNAAEMKKTNLRIFKRFVITQKTRMSDFINIVTCDFAYSKKIELMYHCKSVAKKILGSQRYYKIWSVFFKYKG